MGLWASAEMATQLLLLNFIIPKGWPLITRETSLSPIPLTTASARYLLTGSSPPLPAMALPDTVVTVVLRLRRSWEGHVTSPWMLPETYTLPTPAIIASGRYHLKELLLLLPAMESMLTAGTAVLP